MLTILFLFLREREELSAVCVFSLSDIIKVMDGPFRELKKTCENWINPEPVPTPRPGQVVHMYYHQLYFIQCLLLHYININDSLLFSPSLHVFLVFEQCFEG